MPHPCDEDVAAGSVANNDGAIERGPRQLDGGVGRLIFWAALSWSLFQLYVASPLPYALGQGFVLGDTESRLIHYAYAAFLTFLLYPAFAGSSRSRVPTTDWIWAVLAAVSSLYMFALYESLARRAGAPHLQDMIVALFGMVCLLEAIRRTIGLPLVIVAVVFLIYVFAGAYMPEAISHPGASPRRASDHLWLSREGVFGFALGVSSSLVFLFVVFGSLLERAGAGNWFIQVSFALLGHLRGGPAKAAVVSSALTGVISGSALANIMTTGTFTIPLMKRVGFPAEKAAGIESTSSINGQLMPPVMGAAAFLMTEFVGISYQEVITHALLPAVLSYVSLFYIVHLEALKLNLPVIERVRQSTFARSSLLFMLSFFGMVLLSAAIYYGLGWVKVAGGSYAPAIIAALVIVTYLGLLWVSAQVPPLIIDDPSTPLDSLPDLLPTVRAGLHFLLPVGVLVWCLMVERLSAGYAVYWAIVAMVSLILTQRPLIALMRGGCDAGAAVRTGCDDLIAGLVSGALHMVPIAIALASAGVIVGAVSLTGLGLVMVNVIEVLSGGNLLAMLFFTAVISIVLGMGLPTTANYVVVASIMAPVVVTLAAQSGVVIPAIAVHLFVFYCGLMSGNTPPVAVDAYAAAALARANAMGTCVQAFYYELRTLILPFIFVFNTELLLIGVDSIAHGAMVVVVALIAMFCFASSTQGYFLVRNQLVESVLLALISFSLLLPSFWLDRLYPAFNQTDPTRIEHAAESAPDGSLMRAHVRGNDFSGQEVQRVVALPLGPPGPDGAQRLWDGAGLKVRQEDDRIVVDDLKFGGPAQVAGMDYDWVIETMETPNARPAKQWVYLPALSLLGLLIWRQRRRQLAGRYPA